MNTDDGSPLEPFPLPEHHDTDRSPLPPEEECMDQHEAAKEVRRKQLETMDAHTLLVSLHLRLDDVDAWRKRVDDRLDAGDGEFQDQKRDIGLVCAAVKSLCEANTLGEHVQALGTRLAERFPSNGVDHDTPTNPENAHPEPDAE